MPGAGFDIVRPALHRAGLGASTYGRLKAVADPRVRQALARALDRSTNGKVALGRSGCTRRDHGGDVGKAGRAVVATRGRRGADDGYAHDPARAAEDLKKLGFAKRAGVWVSPQGERSAHELTSPPSTRLGNASARTWWTRSTTSATGWPFRTVPAANWSGMQQKGKYDTGLVAWGSGDPHPYTLTTWSLVLDTRGSGAGPGYRLRPEAERARAGSGRPGEAAGPESPRSAWTRTRRSRR